MRSARLVSFTIVFVLLLAMAVSAGGCARKSGSTGGASLPSTEGSSSASTSDTTGTLGGTLAKEQVSGVAGSAGTAGGSGAVGGASGSSGSGGGSASKSGGTPNTKPGAPGAEAGMKIKVLWWNDTSSKAPRDWEIVYGGSIVKPGSGKQGTGEIGPAPYGRSTELVIYPDGRGGKKIVVPITVTTGMQPNSTTDAIHVAVSDSSVRVLGNAVDNVDETYPRF